MKEINIEYAIHLDNLRKSFGLTVEKLCEGICNARQFRRYKTGENELSNPKIIEFCKNLGLSPDEFFYSFKERDSIEHKNVSKLFNLIAARRFEDYFKSDFTSIRKGLVNVKNIKWLDYCTERALNETKRKHDFATLDTVKEIMNYPECLHRNAYDFIDVLYILFIAELEVKHNEVNALNCLIEILKDKNKYYISPDYKNVYPSIYGTASILLGRLKRYKESLEICNLGIEFTKLHRTLEALSHLRYMKAYNLKVLGFVHEAEKEAIRCLMTSIAKDDEFEAKMFYRVLKKDFNIDPFDNLLKYKDELLYSDKE
jgi:transcriptional regulator with XRE-family HTH domain